MLRVLHVVDLRPAPEALPNATCDHAWGAPDAHAACRWVEKHAASGEHALVLVGASPQAAADPAWLAAFRCVHAVPARLFRAWLSGRAVRCAWRAIGEPERVVCWNVGGFEAASGIPESKARLTLALHDPGALRLPPALSGGARVVFHAPVHRIVCAGDPPSWIEAIARGAPVQMCEVDPPGLSAGAAVKEHEERADSVRVALLGRAPHADAMRFAFLIGLEQYAGCEVRGVVGESASSIGRARRYARSIPGISISRTARSPREVLRASDLAVWVGAGEGATRPDLPQRKAAAISARDCIEMEVPFVAPRWAVPEGWLCEDACELALASSAALTELARLLAPLASDLARRRALRASLREAIATPQDGVPFFADVLRETLGIEPAVVQAGKPG